MDALPHFGYAGKKGYEEVLKYKLSYIVAASTLVTSLAVIAFLVAKGQWLALSAGLVAASPDAIGLYNWLAYEKRGKKAGGFLKLFHVKFHRHIQWCERPWGSFVEIAVCVGLAIPLLILLR